MVEIPVKQKVQHFKDLVGQKLTQYASNGNKVASYLTINDAARATKVGATCICEALNGKQKSAGGGIWKKGWNKGRIDLSGYRFGEALRIEHKQVKVKQYGLDGRYIGTFPSVKTQPPSISLLQPSLQTIYRLSSIQYTPSSQASLQIFSHSAGWGCQNFRRAARWLVRSNPSFPYWQLPA
jgi:hypothetical protein